MSSESEPEEAMQTLAKRQKKMPNKFKDFSVQEGEMPQNRVLTVKCSQTGKLYKTQLQNVTKSDMTPLVEEDFKRGSSLVMDYNGKPYPVEFISFSDKDVEKAKAQKRKHMLEAAKNEMLAKSSRAPKRRKALLVEESDESDSNDELIIDEESIHHDSTKKLNEERSLSPAPVTMERNLLIAIDKNLRLLLAKVDNFEKRMEKFEEFPSSAEVAKESTKEINKFIINGVDIRRIHGQTPPIYGRLLLDCLFTRKEQSESVILESQKSTRPGLPKDRVDMLFNCVQQRFPDCNTKDLIRNLNQKCRDSGRLIKGQSN